MEHKLRRCPFCGGAAELRECRVYRATGWRVKCTRCKVKTEGVYINLPATKPGVSGPFLDESTRYTSDQAAKIAVDTWNRRVGGPR